METRIYTADASTIAQAAKLIQQGELVAFPTETVYGLGSSALDPVAAQKIFAAKGRPAHNPLIVHIASVSDLAPLIDAPPSLDAQKLMRAFWPGPLTLLFLASDRVPSVVRAGLRTVAVRMPAHPVARELIQQAGVPVVAPSANVSGRPSPTRAQAVFDDLAGRIPFILDGGNAVVGLESTVVDVSGERPVVLRLGGVSTEEIEQVIGAVEVFVKETGRQIRSPGQLLKHYTPALPVLLFVGSHAWVQPHLEKEKREGDGILTFHEFLSAYASAPLLDWGPRSDRASHAAVLFDHLRASEKNGWKRLLVEYDKIEGIGEAVLERLERASTQKYYESTHPNL